VTTRPRHTPDITATRLTAPGRGAVASVRLSSSTPEQSITLDQAFTAANGMLASSAPVDRVLFGSWRGEDVVVVRTAETEWEVHCHGGEAAVTHILSEFGADASCVAVPKSPLDQLLLQTRTTKTGRLVLAQSAGLLRNTLVAMTKTRTVADFRQQLHDLLRWEQLANHLVNSWQVVIAGPPNTGKSSLLNAIAGYERSIVFDQPGTTRDALTTELVFNGWPFCFVDTAGIRQQSDDPVESIGITNARNLLDAADLILIAVDHSVGWTNDHDDIVQAIPTTTPRGIVQCKADLNGTDDLAPKDATVLETSALEGDGIRELTNWVVTQLIPHEPTLQTPLPLAGSADICRSLLQRCDEEEPIGTLQIDLTTWYESALGADVD